MEIHVGWGEVGSKYSFGMGSGRLGGGPTSIHVDGVLRLFMLDPPMVTPSLRMGDFAISSSHYYRQRCFVRVIVSVVLKGGLKLKTSS